MVYMECKWYIQKIRWISEIGLKHDTDLTSLSSKALRPSLTAKIWSPLVISWHLVNCQKGPY